MAAKSHTANMAAGPLFPEIFAYSFPLILSGFLQLCFNAADMVVVGRFASMQSLGAVGATGSFCNLVVTVFLGLSVGANVLVSNRFGAGDRRGVSRAAHTSMTVAAFGGVALAVLGMAISRPVLRLTGVPGDILCLSSLYMKIFCLGIPFSLVFNFGAAIMRALGDTRRPLLYLMAAGAVNVALNLVFVIAFKMDVAGVALATVASQALSAALALRALVRSRDACRLRPRLLRIDGATARELIRTGLPAGLQSAMYSLANLVVQSGVNSFGAAAIAGNTAALSIEGFVYVSTNAYYQAVTTIVGQNAGARKFGRVVKGFLHCVWLAVALNVVLGVAVYAFAPELVAFYNAEPEVVAFGVEKIHAIIFGYVLCSIMDVITGTLRGLGHSVFPAAATLVGACLLRVVWVAWVFPLKRELWFLYLCMPVSWVAVSIVNGSYLWRVLAHARRRRMH